MEKVECPKKIFFIGCNFYHCLERAQLAEHPAMSAAVTGEGQLH